jgi:hypothetical protein
METFTNLTKTEQEALETLRTRSDWDEGYRHDCLMTQRSYGFLIPSVRAAKFIPWQVQFAAIIEASGFVVELGE